MAIEPKVNELATFFLPDDAPTSDKESLAQHLQDMAEAWLKDNGYGPDEKDEDGTEDGIEE